MGLFSISTCSTGLLIVTLKTLGQISMNNKTDVGFVDTHAESYSGDDQLHFIVVECILILLACAVVEPGVVGQGMDACMGKRCRRAFDIIPCCPIHNAGFSWPRTYESKDLGLHILLWRYLIVEVGAVERGSNNVRVSQAETDTNVGLNTLRR